MPKRPPKKWMKDCTTGVEKSGSKVNSGAVCGDIWYNKKTQKERDLITKRIEKGNYKSGIHRERHSAEEFEAWLAEEEMKARHDDKKEERKRKGKN